MRPITSDDLRRFAVARSLFPPATLRRAIARMRFVQADPIRAPARAQDLILRHRVKDYRAGDLERNYVSLKIEEDTLVLPPIRYGFLRLRARLFPLAADVELRLRMMPFSVKAGRGGQRSFRRRPDRAP